MNSKRKRGLFYSRAIYFPRQSLASQALCRQLAEAFDVDFISSTPVDGSLMAMPHFHLLVAPPFEASQRVDRLAYLEKEVKPPYDFFMTEVFPFRDHHLEEEIAPLIDRLKQANPDCRIICSLSDAEAFIQSRGDAHTLRILKERYEALFIHVDPSVIPLKKSLRNEEKFPGKVLYTGFIPNSLEELPSMPKRQKRIVLLLSKDPLGMILAKALLKVIAYFPDYEFAFVMPPVFAQELEEFVKNWKKTRPREGQEASIQLLPAQKSLVPLLTGCRLAISCADLTLIDMVYTRTPALVLAGGHMIYFMLLKFFVAQGFVRKMSLATLSPESLRDQMREALAAPYPDSEIDTAGAAHTLALLKHLLETP